MRKWEKFFFWLIPVLLITCVIVTMVSRRYVLPKEESKRHLNWLRLEKIERAISQYSGKHGSFPPNLSSLCNGAEGFCLQNDRIDLDAWGFSLQYEIDPDEKGYLVESLGADHERGGVGENEDQSRKGRR